jgi:uncharacterized protein (TIGR04255 family)
MRGILSNNLPKKLKHDAIVEATFEVRFDSEELSAVTEVLLGRLADTPAWQGFTQRRLPTADIPAAFRRADANLRYQAAIELLAPSGTQRVAIGPNSLSFSRMAPYPGWEAEFKKEVEGVIDILFRVVPKIVVTRLGLRYINALRSNLHGISGIESLNLKVSLGGDVLTRKLNVNYTVPTSSDSSCAVRIASVDLAQGQIPEHTTVIADVDVYTNDGYSSSDATQAKAWCETAHQAEKMNFFKLLTHETVEKLRAD